MLEATSLTVSPLNVPLLSPFGIATGAQHVAHNVLVRLETNRGVVGFGEGAPVEHISGENQQAVLEAINSVKDLIEGKRLEALRPVCLRLREALAHVPSGLSAVEIAVFDVFCKHHGMSMLQLFGAAQSKLTTDITITTGTREESGRSATKYAAQGFSKLKIKIGGSSLEQDVARLLAISEAAPGAELILDGNTAFSPAEAIELLDELGPIRKKVALFEQPVERDDFEGLREVEAKSGIMVAADESLRSENDFRRVISVGGISAINIKTAKLGLLQGWDLLVSAKRCGLAVMVGGMVETELSMTTSACLAAGVGGVEFVDLDTPMLLADRPLRGGYRQSGPELDLGSIELGHGVTPVS